MNFESIKKKFDKKLFDIMKVLNQNTLSNEKFDKGQF